MAIATLRQLVVFGTGVLIGLLLPVQLGASDAGVEPAVVDREIRPRGTIRSRADTITDPFAERIPGYLTTLRYLRALVPRPDTARAEADPAAGLKLDLVVDETQTQMGREFFDAFYAAWERPEDAPNATIRVQEFLVPGIGTRVAVQIDGQELFQLQLQPDSETIRELGRQAAAYVRQELGRSPGLFGVAPGGER